VTYQDFGDYYVLKEDNDRLRKRITNQKKEIDLLRYVVILLFKMGGGRWRIVGEGRRKHLNDGKGTSYGALEEIDGGKVIFTGAAQARAVERALKST
jgi:hypothetical protein